MPLRGDPTTGPKLPFHAPIPASKDQQENGVGIDRTFARVLCKDAIGAFLGLPRAPYRVSVFTDGGDGQPQSNSNTRFAINEKVGARPYIITLLPGTQVLMGRYDWSVDSLPPPTPVGMKTLQVYVPAHVQVWSMLRWLGQGEDAVIIGNTPSEPLPGFPVNLPNLYPDVNENYQKIASVTTPSGRKYNIRSLLYPESVDISLPVVPGTPSPSPSPTP